MIIDVPKEFRPHIGIDYPGDNHLIFEEWFYAVWKESKKESRFYLPVFWTSYYVNNRFGKDTKALARLQKWIDSLDRNLKYYTIVQYDDGILNNISKLDIKVFAMSGKRVDYPLPLICQPHDFPLMKTGQKDVLFANYIGRETHPIRKDMLSFLQSKNLRGYYLSSVPLSLVDFCKVLRSSTFTICPRGYGQTSFRIAEAMQHGSIPVYISDQFILPHNISFEEYGIKIHGRDAHRVDSILRKISPQKIASLQRAVCQYYQKYFTYQANRQIILKQAG